jgi:uncharacterized cysteine cluster protein YcgN (CxxCxxCC family)
MRTCLFFIIEKLTNLQSVSCFGANMSENDEFWKTTPLEELTGKQWEQLCDGCGRCCLVKLEDEDSGQIYATSVSCELFDTKTCRCLDYKNRFEKVTDCLDLDTSKVRELSWLPTTCAYRLRMEGKQLYDWHPLNSGTRQSVIDAGVSIAGQTINELDVSEDRLGDYLHEWPISAKT